MTNDKVLARIHELKTNFAEGVIQLAIRERSARVQILQDQLNRLLRLIEARASEYSDHPGGATGLLVKDYRGKNAEREVWKFDAALVAQINQVLKQAAIEEGQWTDKRGAQGDVDINLTMQKLNAGRQRVAEEKAKPLRGRRTWWASGIRRNRIRGAKRVSRY
ncbi:MAG: hypothetical protein ACLQU1_16620 [Bryobacteraceae bacterium]